jgi:hypothetical protein
VRKSYSALAQPRTVGPRLAAKSGALAVSLLLVIGAAQAAEAQTFIGGTSVWTVVAAPTASPTGIAPTEATAFSNHASVDVTGIVLLVLKNTAGQTIYYTSATVTIAPGGIGTSYDAIFGVAPGTYNATIFAIAASGVAISASTSVPFTSTGVR